ncbi:MAG: hypothetical protein MOGDAGHF_02872 [Rhodocyclaceae bacterium]|nr:hypothetical protein [Rhodocyclaceae bacterium]
MDEQGAAACRLLGQQRGRGGIHGVGLLRLALRLVDGGVGGSVDDDVGARFIQLAAHGGGIGEVQLGMGAGMDAAQRQQGAHEFPADLTVPAGDEDVHGNSSATAKGTPLTSLAESVGALVSGQGIASSGSFQRTQRSCSGA